MGSQSKRGLKNRNANSGGQRLANDAPGSRPENAARFILSAPRSKSRASRCLRCRDDEETKPTNPAGRRMSGVANPQRATIPRVPASAAAVGRASHARNDTAQPANTPDPSSVWAVARNSASGGLAGPPGLWSAQDDIPASNGDLDGSFQNSARAFATTGRCRLEI
jgi:hypothetical protein